MTPYSTPKEHMNEFEGALVRMRPCFVCLGSGTIVEVNLNYKDQIETIILWANGYISTEKLGDLEVIQLSLPH